MWQTVQVSRKLGLIHGASWVAQVISLAWNPNLLEPSLRAAPNHRPELPRPNPKLLAVGCKNRQAGWFPLSLENTKSKFVPSNCLWFSCWSPIPTTARCPPENRREPQIEQCPGAALCLCGRLAVLRGPLPRRISGAAAEQGLRLSGVGALNSWT